ncbi:MAG: hypothetical protein ACKVOU_15480 [Cytophagales bacterium]
MGYLYMVVSFADSVLTDSETEMAKEKLGNFLKNKYPDKIHLPSPIINEIISEIQHHTNAEKYDLVRQLTSRFNLGQDLKMDIVGDLADIVAADDVVDLEEHKVLAYIRGVFYDQDQL